MDVDWCLSCGRRIEGTEPYCSAECLNHDGPSSSSYLPPPFSLDSPSEYFSEDEDEDDIIYHQVEAAPKSQWIGKGPAGIAAWASDIPSGAPAGAPSINDHFTPPPSPPLPAFRPPKLLLPHQRPMPPTLCMSTPQPARPCPSLPIVTPQQQIANLSLSHSADPGSAGRTSLLSGVTESSIATPLSAAPVPIANHKCAIQHRTSVLGALATQVRSWVSPCPPQPQLPKYTSHVKQPRSSAAPQRVDSTAFTILAKTHHSSALQILSPSRSSLDETSSDEMSPVWWVSSMDAGTKADSRSIEKKTLGEPPRGRRLGLALGVRDTHPAYRSRGRKPSRAVA